MHPSWTSLWQKTAMAPSLSVKQQIDFRTELAFVPKSQIHFRDLKQNSLFSCPCFSQPCSLRSSQAVLWRMALCPTRAFWKTAGAMLFSPGQLQTWRSDDTEVVVVALPPAHFHLLLHVVKAGALGHPSLTSNPSETRSPSSRWISSTDFREEY